MAWTAVIAAAAPIAQSAINTSNKKDPERFATAQRLQSGALAGDADDACALRHFSGRYGCATCGRHGQVCGFATQAAKDYAGKLYDQYLAKQSGIVQMGAPQELPPTQTGVPVTVETTSGSGGSGATIQVGSAPATARERQMWIAVAVVASVALGAYLFMRRG